MVDGGEVDRERLAAKTVGMLAAAQLAGAVRATLAGGGEKEEGAGGTSVGRHGHSLSRKSSSSLRAWEAAATQVLHHHARSGSAMRAASVHAPRPSHASAAATSTDATASRLQHRTVMDVFSGPQSAAAAAASVAAAAAIDAEARAAAAAEAAHDGGGSTLPPHA
ncbi:hypothetical protein EON68_00225 [archaeon]|nr:MAG: hypothetical protein EON68_00225 [archaeon]